MRWRSRISISTEASRLLAAPRPGGFLLHLLVRLELAQRLVGTRHHRLAGLELPEHLDHRLAGDARAHRYELGDAVAHHEQAGDLLLLAADRIVLGRDRLAALGL